MFTTSLVRWRDGRVRNWTQGRGKWVDGAKRPGEGRVGGHLPLKVTCHTHEDGVGGRGG